MFKTRLTITLLRVPDKKRDRNKIHPGPSEKGAEQSFTVKGVKQSTMSAGEPRIGSPGKDQRNNGERSEHLVLKSRNNLKGLGGDPG